MKTEPEDKRLCRLLGGRAHKGQIVLSLAQARLLAQEVEVLDALVHRRILSPEHELLTPDGPEPLLDPGQEGL